MFSRKKICSSRIPKMCPMLSSIDLLFPVNPICPISHFIFHEKSTFPCCPYLKTLSVIHTTECLFSFSCKNSTRRNGIICSRREFTRSSRGLKMCLVSDNLAKKAIEFSLLTSANPYLPRDAMLRQKRRELAAMAKKWMNYIAFSSLCCSSQSSLNVNTLKGRLFVKTEWQNTQKENIGLCSVNFFLSPIYIHTHPASQFVLSICNIIYYHGFTYASHIYISSPELFSEYQPHFRLSEGHFGIETQLPWPQHVLISLLKNKNLPFFPVPDLT